MMYPYPFFGFPPFRRPYPYHSNYSLHNTNVKKQNSEVNPSFPNSFSNSHTISRPDSNTASSQHLQNSDDEQEECFEIFGLKLHFDDLLLIALLFFLYREEVKDSYLYMALILLLLS